MTEKSETNRETQESPEGKPLSAELLADAAWLRQLAPAIADVAKQPALGDANRQRLLDIAERCEMMSNMMYDPGIAIERRVERALAGYVEAKLRHAEHDEFLADVDAVALAAWRLGNITRSAATKSSLGPVLSMLAMGFAGRGGIGLGESFLKSEAAKDDAPPAPSDGE